MKHNIQNQSSTVVNKGSSKGLMVITGVTLALSVIGIFAYIRYFSQKKTIINNKYINPLKAFVRYYDWNDLTFQEKVFGLFRLANLFF